MRINQLNERGRLRWVDGERGELRFRYRNRFYGECNLRVRINFDVQGRPALMNESVTTEQIQPSARGERLLRQAALRFLRQAMLRQPEIFLPPASQTGLDANWWSRLVRRWRLRASSLSIKA